MREHNVSDVPRFRSIRIPDSVRGIAAEAFYRCEALETVQLPSGLTQIEPGTFRLCRNLREILLPASIREIGKQAFAGCTHLESILCRRGWNGSANPLCRLPEHPAD